MSAYVSSAHNAVPNRSRRIRHLLTGTLAATLLSVVALAGPARAASNPGTTMDCGGGAVLTMAPVVVAQQGLVGSRGYDVHWITALYRYTDAAGWQFVQWSDWYGAYVSSNDASPGSTSGYAGPDWTNTRAGGTTNHMYFQASAGAWYAIINWVYDRGEWSSSWAMYAKGGYSCYM